ncbi:hypothetical protein ABPG75_001790 [Micractinium tetrahymenae]
MAAIQRDADLAISNNEREFILKALKEGQRIDGRGPHELRPPRFSFALDDCSASVQLGGTRVMAVVTATLEAPYADRHNEGSLRFNVEFSPMASPAFEPGRPGEDAVEVARLVERGLRESRAVDLEALVVLAGRKVWHLRVDIHVLDHQGNLVDACALVALAALMAFRRPDVTVGGGDDSQAVTVHPQELREPVPLSIHHLPLPVSFALWEDGELIAVDPSLKEEAAAAGKLTVTQNAFGELCSLQKIEGCGLGAPQLMRCVRLAATKVEELTAALRKALDAHAVARVQARVRRQPGAAAAAGAAGAAGVAGVPPRGVTVLRSDQLLPAVAAGSGRGGGAAGAAVALDLDALPDSVRSMLQQAAEAPADVEEDDVEEEEDSSSEEESSSSEGEGSSEEEAPDDDDDDEAAATAAPVRGSAATHQQAAASMQQEQQQEQQQAQQQRLAGQAKKRRAAAPGSASKEQQRDELAAIADMIASAGGGTSAPPADLSGAVKKKKKQGGGAARRE